jgi:DNA-binding beta-propeller fold protein YncE
MNIVLRAAAAAALLLPLALPASASQLPLNAQTLQALPKGVGPAEIFRSHAHRSSKTAHFSFPYGLAVDPSGNLFVANTDSNSIAIVSPTYKIATNAITNSVSTPLSVAIGPGNDVYVGNLGNGGSVTHYKGSTLVQTIIANATEPASIAVDEFGDLYLTSQQGIALDDPYGNSLFPAEYGGYAIDSIALGNDSVYAFVNGNYLQGNGSPFVRSGALQSINGPDGSTYPAGAACGSGFCWYTDTDGAALWLSNGSNPIAASLGYRPGGVAVDLVRNRAYVADPDNNAIHVYNAQTLALEKTLI